MCQTGYSSSSSCSILVCCVLAAACCRIDLFFMLVLTCVVKMCLQSLSCVLLSKLQIAKPAARVGDLFIVRGSRYCSISMLGLCIYHNIPLVFTEGRLKTWNTPENSCLKIWLTHKVHQWATILRFLPTLWYLHSLLCSFEDLLSQLHQQWSPLCYASVVRLTLSLSLPTAHYIHSLQAHHREREIIFMLFPWSTSLSRSASLFSFKSFGISEQQSHSESLAAHGPLRSSPPSAEIREITFNFKLQLHFNQPQRKNPETVIHSAL